MPATDGRAGRVDGGEDRKCGEDVGQRLPSSVMEVRGQVHLIERVPGGAEQLSDVPRPIRPKLDSGATASVLYNPAKYQAPRLVRSGLRRRNGTDGEQRDFAGLPAQQVKIDSLELRVSAMATGDALT